MDDPLSRGAKPRWRNWSATWKRRTLGYKVIWSTLTSLVAPTNFWALKTSLGLNLTFLTITTHGVNYFLKEHSYSKLFCQQGNIWPNSYQRDALVWQSIIILALLNQSVHLVTVRSNVSLLKEQLNFTDQQFQRVSIPHLICSTMTVWH